MLQLNDALSQPVSPYQERRWVSSEKRMAPQFDLLSLVRTCYRRWPTIAATILIFSLVAIAYIFVASPRFTSSFLILVDSKKNELLSREEPSVDRILDPGIVESQVEILKSDSVAEMVVRQLNLHHDPDFLNEGKNLFSPLFGMISGLTTRIVGLFSNGISNLSPTDDQQVRAAVELLTNAIKAKRIGLTYVIQVDYTGSRPNRTAQISNALAESYMVGELEARFQATKRASKWLQDRLAELQTQVSLAESAVQRFKSENNIVNTSRGLMNEQQLTDVNSQLIAARAATAEAKARFDRVSLVQNGDMINGAVADALKNEVITRLRAQYLDLSNRAADLASRYGDNHSIVLVLRSQMNEIARSARDELGRVAASTRSDYEILLAREESLKKSLENLVQQSAVTNQAQVKLRNLESSAQTYRNLYDTFLQKFEESTKSQTFPVNNARVITPPNVPEKPSWPKPLIIILAALLVGAASGVGLAAMQELFGNNFRSPDDVNNYAGMECLGILPSLPKNSRIKRGLASNREVLGDQNPIARQVVLAPFSRFAETLRNVKVSLDSVRAKHGGAIIGIVSAVPGEGKTTVAANLAFLTAQMGHRVLLIDGDLHLASLSSLLLADNKFGLAEVLTQRSDIQSVIVRDKGTSLDFIPTVSARKANTPSLLTSDLMRSLLERARERYDYVYIDLPPVVPVVDAKAVAAQIDSFVFVIEWGKTSRDVVREAILGAEAVRQRIIGAVLNKADAGELRRLESYKGGTYTNYYTDDERAA